jgi:hypothetical protein
MVRARIDIHSVTATKQARALEQLRVSPALLDRGHV